MKLYCDENVGTGVPNALEAVGLDAHSSVSAGFRGQTDLQWLEIAGRAGWLVITRDLRMFKNPEERRAIEDYLVGIVCFTNGQLRPRDMLRLLLNKWDTLERLDRDVPRPFARFLSSNGRLSASFRGLSI